MGFGWIYCQCPCCLAQLRFIVAVFGFAAVLVGYCHRASLNIGMVEMVEQKESKSTCPVQSSEGAVIKDISGGKIGWTESEQGYNLAAFYWGYLVSHIPAGIMCDIYGPRYPLLVGMIFSTVSTGLIPVAAIYTDAWWPVFILRVFTGFGQGAIFPGISSLMSRWIPPVERASVGAAVFAANAFGLVFGNMITGFVINWTRSWPAAFYMWGIIGTVYCLLFVVYTFSDPRTHPFLHPVEMDYLQNTMQFKQAMKIPIVPILKDKSVYGLIIIQLGHDLLMFTFANNLPKYMNQVLGMNIKENAMIAFIFMLQWVSGFIAGVISDYLVKKKNANVTFMRKFYTAISNLGSLCFCAGAVYSECNISWSITCFGFAIFCKGIFFAGGKVNIIDVSLNHSGLIMSIVNGIGALMGIACSTIIGLIVTDNTFEQWWILVAGTGVFEVITLILYIILTSAERSDWDYAEGEQQPPKKKHKWYQQMTNSDHQLRLEKDKQSAEARKQIAAEAKAKMKEEMRQRLAAKDNK